MLHINKMSTASTASARATTIKKQQQQEQLQRHELNTRHNSTSGNDNGSGATVAAAVSATTIDAHSMSATTNITQISNSNNSNNSSGGVSVGASYRLGGSNDNSITSDSSATASSRRGGNVSGAATARSAALVQELYFPVSVRAVIGISWLPPLLYAIAVPLIFSIIGKWPRNWWLEVMSNTTAGATTTTTMSGTMYSMPHGLSHAFGGGYSGGSDYLAAHMAPSPSSASSLSLKVEPNHNDNQSNDVYSMLSSTTSGSILELASVTATTGILTTTGPIAATTNIPIHNNGTTASASTSTASTSTTFSVVGWHNNFQPAAISASATAAAYHGDFAAYIDSDSAELESQLTGDGSVPSLSFIIFICVDLLFILLFFALYVILIKKLLWLWHKNRNIHAHPQDKLNVAMRRR